MGRLWQPLAALRRSLAGSPATLVAVAAVAVVEVAAVFYLLFDHGKLVAQEFVFVLQKKKKYRLCLGKKTLEGELFGAWNHIVVVHNIITLRVPMLNTLDRKLYKVILGVIFLTVLLAYFMFLSHSDFLLPLFVRAAPQLAQSFCVPENFFWF